MPHPPVPAIAAQLRPEERLGAPWERSLWDGRPASRSPALPSSRPRLDLDAPCSPRPIVHDRPASLLLTSPPGRKTLVSFYMFVVVIWILVCYVGIAVAYLVVAVVLHGL